MFHDTHIRHSCHAALPFKIRGNFILHKVRQFIDIFSLIADADIHGRHHIHTDFHNIGRAAGIRQGRLKLVYRRGNFYHGRVHAGILRKLQSHHGIIFRTGTGDIFHPAYGAKGALHRLGHTLLHLLRACSRICGDYHHIGHIHFRQKICFHTGEGHKADYQHNNHCN